MEAPTIEKVTNPPEAPKSGRFGFLKKLFGSNGSNSPKSPEEVGLSVSSAAQPEELRDGHIKPEGPKQSIQMNSPLSKAS